MVIRLNFLEDENVFLFLRTIKKPFLYLAEVSICNYVEVLKKHWWMILNKPSTFIIIDQQKKKTLGASQNIITTNACMTHGWRKFKCPNTPQPYKFWCKRLNTLMEGTIFLSYVLLKSTYFLLFVFFWPKNLPPPSGKDF